MDKKKIPFNAYLIAILLFLSVLYGISFLKNPAKDTRKVTKTALINPKYESIISQIQISAENQLLVLQKNQEWWEIVDFENPLVKLPADSVRVNKMLSELCKVISIYKVSSKENDQKNNNFGFNSSGINISFSTSEKEISELCFGKSDFSQSKRFVKTSDSNTVYEMEDFISSYLTASLQSWSEPLIISQQILGTVKTEDVQRVVINNSTVVKNSSETSTYISKLLELRHGGINPDFFAKSENPVYSLKLELGNKNNIFIKVWETEQEGTYLLFIEYDDSVKGSVYSYFCNASAWTFSKLKYE